MNIMDKCLQWKEFRQSLCWRIDNHGSVVLLSRISIDGAMMTTTSKINLLASVFQWISSPSTCMKPNYAIPCALFACGEDQFTLERSMMRVLGEAKDINARGYLCPSSGVLLNVCIVFPVDMKCLQILFGSSSSLSEHRFPWSQFGVIDINKHLPFDKDVQGMQVLYKAPSHSVDLSSAKISPPPRIFTCAE